MIMEFGKKKIQRQNHTRINPWWVALCVFRTAIIKKECFSLSKHDDQTLKYNNDQFIQNWNNMRSLPSDKANFKYKFLHTENAETTGNSIETNSN